jgi:peptide/nickel transport system permease protein
MTEIEPTVEVERSADLRYALHLFRKNPLVLAGLVLSVGSILVALLSHVLVSPATSQHLHPVLKNCWDSPLINWGNVNIATCPTYHALGTDSYGRDLLQMIILAIPTDLQIALEVVLSAVVIGITFGATASYAGGIVDEIILRVTDIFLAVPGILLAIVFMVVFGRTIPVLTGAVLLIWWPTYVRLVRSQVLSEKERPYVEALRSIGAGRVRILFRHIVPNSIYPLLVQATLDIGSVILTVSALTFIGLSPSPLLPELGNLASLGSQYFFTAPWLIIFPGLTILLISLGFNLLGDGLRDILDPRMRR